MPILLRNANNRATALLPFQPNKINCVTETPGVSKTGRHVPTLLTSRRGRDLNFALAALPCFNLGAARSALVAVRVAVRAADRVVLLGTNTRAYPSTLCTHTHTHTHSLNIETV